MSKLLLIDDEEGARKLLRISLVSDGYSVITAENGRQGIELFEQHRPSIVLIDIRMPGMSGLDVLKMIKETDAETEVIVITAHADMEIAIKSLQLDASDFITKPISIEVLSAALNRAEERLRLKTKIKSYTSRLENEVKTKSEELSKSYEEMETACEITCRVNEKKTLAEAFDFIINQVKHIFLFDKVIPLLLNKEKDDFIKIADYMLPDAGERRSLVSVVASMHHPVDITELSAMEHKSLNGLEDCKSQCIVPMVRGDEPVGAVILLAFAHNAFSSEDMRFFYLMLTQVAGVIRKTALSDERARDLENRVKTFSGFSGIIGKDHKMRQVYDLISDIAPTDATVLIQGESGSGKELVARAIHCHSLRKENSFVVVNCSAFPETLFESELFGYEKGAFTGAGDRRIGRFELAHRGTLFLDEIAELSLVLQVKLLRFLQFRKLERLGGTDIVEVDVRVLAATNKDLKKQVEKGSFREDLYYRLNVIPVNMPPLRAKRGDISLLVEYFLKRLNSKGNKSVKNMSSKAMRVLMGYNWPGNVRELENVLEHAFILAKDDIIGEKSLPLGIRFGPDKGKKIISFEENEKRFLARTLEEHKWNKLQVAKHLNISRSTLYAKLKKYNILQSGQWK